MTNRELDVFRDAVHDAKTDCIGLARYVAKQEPGYVLTEGDVKALRQACAALDAARAALDAAFVEQEAEQVSNGR